MGVCVSCLGLQKEDDDSASPLLIDETPNYGAIAPDTSTPPASTAAADTRNDKELEHIVNLTSRKLISIYDAPESQEPSTMSPYSEIVRKLSGEDLLSASADEVDDWGSDTDDDGDIGGQGQGGMKSYAGIVKRPDVGPLTTTLKQSEAN